LLEKKVLGNQYYLVEDKVGQVHWLDNADTKYAEMNDQEKIDLWVSSGLDFLTWPVYNNTIDSDTHLDSINTYGHKSGLTYASPGTLE
jgi:hypothetical protein